VRIDMLERLADLIRPLIAWRPDGANAGQPPKGSTGDGGFRPTPEMMSILGCSVSELGNVLQALGFRLDRVRKPAAAPVPVQPEAASADVAPVAVEAGAAGNGADVPMAEAAAPEEAQSPPEEAPSPQEQAQAAEPVAEAAAPEETLSPPEEAPSSQEPAQAAEPAPSAAAPLGTAEQQQAAPDQKPDQPAAEVEWDEIWRPRRQGGRPPRQRGRGRERDAKPAEDRARQPARASQGKPPQGRRERHERRREGPGGQRRGERPRPFMQSAAPPPKSGVDPDSPFAALYALKLTLEKPTQD
jgi:ATP-dependent RNA helicase SUPV3L1/SUV3